MHPALLITASLLAPIAGLILTPLPAPGAQPAPPAEHDPALRAYLSGNGLLNRALYEPAAAEYRAFLGAHADHPKATTARYGLGVALFRTGDFDGAAAELDQLQDRPDFPFDAEVDLLLAQCDLARARYPDAAPHLDRMLRDHPDHPSAPDAAALLAEARYRAGDYAAVEAPSRLLVTRWPENALRDRAELFWSLADFALRHDAPGASRLIALLERSPQSPFADQAALLVAQSHHRAADDGSSEQAERYYRQAMNAADPRVAADALLGLATLLHARGDASQANAVLDDLLAKFPIPTSPERERAAGAGDASQRDPRADHARFLRARILFDLGDYKDASKAFAAAATSSADLADQAQYWLAKCELRTDQPKAAAERLARAIEEHPESSLLPEMLHDRAVALLRADDPAAAADALRQFRSRFPSHALLPEATELLAALTHRAGDYPASLALCREFAERFPQHPLAPSVAFLAAENLFLSGDLDQAATAYERFLADFPDHERAGSAGYRLGTALFRLQRYAEAEPHLAAAVDGPDAEPAVRPALLCLGDIAFQRADWPAAERRFAAYLDADPHAPGADDALLRLGLARQRQDRPAEAIDAYAQLLDGFPSSPHRLQAEFEQAQSLLALGRDAEAAALFERVVAHDPESRFASHALAHRGAIALAAGEFAAAADQFDLAAKSGADPAAQGEALYQKGRALLGAGRFAPASEPFARLVREHPSHRRVPQAAAHAAIAQARVERSPAALDALERALAAHADRLEPALRDTLDYERAACLRDLGRTDEAADACRALLARAPDSPLAPYAGLDLAAIESDAGRPDAAAQLLTRVRSALGALPDLPAELGEQATYRLAAARLEMGRSREAADLFAEFLDAHPESDLAPSAHLLSGESLMKLDRHAEAADRFRRVVEGSSPDDLVPPALLRLGEALAGAQDWPASERAFASYLGRFGSTDAWFQAGFGLGWAIENQSRYDDAVAAYRGVVERHQGPTAARAQFQIGECLFAQGRHEDAVRELVKVDILYAYPEWSAAALYEAGRCFEAMSRQGDAAAQFKLVQEKHAGTRWAALAADRLDAMPVTSPTTANER